jgi:hypothetical protein
MPNQFIHKSSKELVSDPSRAVFNPGGVYRRAGKLTFKFKK